ncbi:hypothetical protein C3K47_07645 [Solitalea longa]|uniref:Thiamine pyrophosphokinase n=1 Tax=Solitalea longa TaxID=2079460 RepID=A0A2S5A3P4_9SPHI|nr:hypothetical protein [Solitalea longa]POY36929.1 hypothetical protein C3K47_07645 [Solitalea longa]
MSSHHVVREKQEPALIILSYNNFDDEYLGQLLEWSPVVFVFENELENLLSKEIKVDGVFTIMDKEIDSLQEFTKVIPLASNTLEEALRYLIEDEFPSVNIIAETSELQSLQPFLNQIDIVLLQDDIKVFPVKDKLEKWYPANEKITIIDFNIDNQYFITGAIQIENNCFETENNGIVTFSAAKSPIFVIEKLT